MVAGLLLDSLNAFEKIVRLYSHCEPDRYSRFLDRSTHTLPTHSNISSETKGGIIQTNRIPSQNASQHANRFSPPSIIHTLPLAKSNSYIPGRLHNTVATPPSTSA